MKPTNKKKIDKAIEFLTKNNISFESKNNGYHLKCIHGDYYPTTRRLITKSGKSHNNAGWDLIRSSLKQTVVTLSDQAIPETLEVIEDKREPSRFVYFVLHAIVTLINSIFIIVLLSKLD